MTEDKSLDCGMDAILPAVDTHRAILALDGVGRIVAINQSYLRLTGYDRHELINRPVWKLLDLAERCAGRLSHLLDLPEGRDNHLPELAHVSKCGRRYRVDARVFVIAGSDGRANLRMVFARPEETGGVISLGNFIQQRDWPAAKAASTPARKPIPLHVAAGRLQPVRH
ncbi:PAS domain S-box protein [Paracoccus aestuariivivens]|uniref:PAS domain S-box protein n=1 Tax=Paracoccus aestuariivivens TaxID=1820333 RepID=A0A6L6JEW9_9RHOB|nr:PAS domain-containing protein [Paracoccus aestuariivivens]MTH78684.1 PAS domain S-box protein [Paracoccus aestuariivivens]